MLWYSRQTGPGVEVDAKQTKKRTKMTMILERVTFIIVNFLIISTASLASLAIYNHAS